METIGGHEPVKDCRNRSSMVASWCSHDDECLVRVVVLKFEQPLSLVKGFFFLPKRQK